MIIVQIITIENNPAQVIIEKDLMTNIHDLDLALVLVLVLILIIENLDIMIISNAMTTIMTKTNIIRQITIMITTIITIKIAIIMIY